MDSAAMISALDDHGFEDTEAARKMQILNAVIGQICAREPWTFLEKLVDVTLDQQKVDLPDDFRAALTFVIPSLGVTLVPERNDTILKNNSSTLSSLYIPRNYYFVGRDMYLLPVPDQAYAAKLLYLCDHPAVDENSAETAYLIPPKHHQVIVDGALVRLYAMEDDPENAAQFRAYFETGITEMADTWKRQFDLPDRVVDVWENGEGWC
jgi:hypothetical protein